MIGVNKNVVITADQLGQFELYDNNVCSTPIVWVNEWLHSGSTEFPLSFFDTCIKINIRYILYHLGCHSLPIRNINYITPCRKL